MGASAKARAATLVSLVVVLLGSAPASAATSTPNGITISPPSQNLTLGPGLLQARTTISLKNNTRAPFAANLSLVDFKALDEQGNISLGQAGIPIAKYGLANWLSLPNGSSVRLTPGQSVSLPVIIDNRTDLTPGGHHAALVVSTISDASDAASISFNQQLVALLFVKKVGGIHYGLELTAVTGDKQANLPDSLTLHFANTGNVYETPRGYVNVTDPKGKLISKGIIDESSVTILEGSSRQLVTLLKPVGSSHLSGRYIATVYYRPDGQPDFASKQIYFEVSGSAARTRVIIVLATVILLLVMYSILRYRRYHR